MTRIELPEQNPRRLAFFLAMEEWVARNLPPEEYFFTWSVMPTVIIGHNQDIYSEVNLEYCRENGIEVVRRRSGGGCVFADGDNIMMSYICPETNVEETFRHYTQMVANQLQKMGFLAEPSGRNDITIGGRKISGNAFYLLKDRSIIHGTMLYDTNIQHMLNAITPSRAKLESHQVKSVEARIIMASRIKPEMSFKQFHDDLTAGLETKKRTLTDAEIKSIEEIEQKYYSHDWLYLGKN